MKGEIIEISKRETEVKEIYYITVIETKERPTLKLGECEVKINEI